MTPRIGWTLAAVTALGTFSSIARADDERSADVVMVGAMEEGTTTRGYSENYLVMPSGSELTGQLRFVMAEPVFSDEPVRFTDVALFDLNGRVGLGRIELGGGITLLPKQPSYTDEKAFQSASLSARIRLTQRTALALTGNAGHLMDHSGVATQDAIGVQWRKRVLDELHFDLGAQVDAVTLTANSSSALLTEVAATSQVVFREPTGHWAGWVGVAYAVPVYASGMDPTTGASTDAQPRLDFRIGSTITLEHQWDLFVEAAVIDRGDLSDPRTRLPILDGGFDQKQFLLGVSRHFAAHSG